MVEMMETTYDKDADAMYLRVRKGKYASNRTIDRQTILDLDAKGNLLGIELLNVSKRMDKRELASMRFKDIANTRRFVLKI